MSINSVSITGNLTRDPELKMTQSGTEVMDLAVAVNERAKNPQTGQWEDRPNYIDCTVFGNRAQALSQWLHKGSKVAIQGRLHYSSWEKDGQRRSRITVIVNELDMMSRNTPQNGTGSPQTNANQYQQPTYATPSYGTPNQPTANQPEFADDDIPF